MKKIILFFLFFTLEYLFGQPVDVSQIPEADIEYDLPEALIGEFILISPRDEYGITITRDNKFIYSYESYQHAYADWSCGHIVRIDDRWFTSPMPYPPAGATKFFYLQNEKSTELHLTDASFSLLNMRAVRKENMPVPANLAADILIPHRLARYQYFEINNSRVDFNEILQPGNYPLSNSLIINNGIVIISCGPSVKEVLKTSPSDLVEAFRGHEDALFMIRTQFVGFIDLIEENDNGFKGIIRFTNGVPYYYIEEGIAQIEKINDDIIITMLYTPDPRRIKIPDGYQFPAKLILEF